MKEITEYELIKAIELGEDISGFNVSNINDMFYIFCNATNFNQDISNWDVSNVEDMRFMFCEAKSFNQDISGWNFSKVRDMYCFLNDATSFSTENYDKLLISLSKQNLKRNVVLGARGVKHSIKAKEARQILINKFDWIIEDGGMI